MWFIHGMWQEVKNAKQAIALLGGPKQVAAMFADVAPATVTMWGLRRIPAKAWLVLAPKLRARGVRFSPLLFDMLEPRNARDGY